MGYYRADDPFVIRKHAQMLTDAGVDVIVFDVTNGATYDHEFLTLCQEYTALRAAGQPTPQIAFLANSGADRVVTHLYESFYAKGLYPDLWFRWLGKPVILAPTEGLSPEILDFFTIRRSWAWTDPNGWFGDGRDKWPWLDNYPQNPGWHESPDKPEQLAVTVAQHPVSNIGRSFHDGHQPPPDQLATDQGLCFAEQLRRALEVNPQFMFITGWNEWVAQRFLSEGNMSMGGVPVPAGETFFVDQYTREYSRDIEPMHGGHGDAYYYQLVAGVRRFKGVRPPPRPTAPVTLDLAAGFAQWQAVGPEYLDDIQDTTHRDHAGWGGEQHWNTSGRNDFDVLKAARDADTLYFYARAAAALTPPDDANWMTLLLNADGDMATGWEGYDFALNRRRASDTVALVERNTGGWNWEPVGEAALRFSGNELHLAVPRALLGLGADRGPLSFLFKWVDNVPDSGNILDFIDQGDVAPNGRFAYRFAE
jgi:hypothetical protein